MKVSTEPSEKFNSQQLVPRHECEGSITVLWEGHTVLTAGPMKYGNKCEDLNKTKIIFKISRHNYYVLCTSCGSGPYFVGALYSRGSNRN